ncbi:WS/DGAT domain-containing protein [Streptomyces sp. NPDC003016]
MHTATTETASRPGVLSRRWFAYEAAHPATSVVIGVVALCAGDPPSREELGLLLGVAVDAYPQLREYARPDSARRRRAMDAPFRVEEQIFEFPVAPGSGQAGLRTALGELAAEPLPDTLWGVWVLHGYEPGEFAVVLRGHHAHFDGLLLSEIVGRVLGGGGPAPGRVVRRRTGAAAGRRGGAWATAWREARALVRDRGRAAQPMPPSTRLTGRLQYMWGSVGSDRMREAAAAHRVTCNDVYLAALAGALRAWAPDPAWLAGGRPVRVLVPISLQGKEGGDGHLSKQATGCWVRLPCHIDDPAQRLAQVTAATARIRASLHDPHTGALVRALTRLLGRFELDLEHYRGWTTMLTSYVPGPAVSPSFAGRTVMAGMPLMYLPSGQYLASALADFGGKAHLCLVADRAVPDLDALARLWVRQVDLLAAR